MSFTSLLNFYQLPDDHLVRENTELNKVLALNETGRKHVTGMYYKHALGTADNNKKLPDIADPWELCLEGQDWVDKDTTYSATPNLTPGTGKTTFGCIAKSPLTSISDISVTTGQCLPRQRTVRSLAFPKAYEKLLASEDTKSAMNGRITDKESLCITDDVLNAKRIGDIQFVHGSCPANYVADPTPFNGYTFCKTFVDKPSAEVLKKYADQLAASEKQRADDLIYAEEEALLAEEEAFEKLTFIEKVKKDTTYQLYSGGGTLLCCCCICLCLIVLLKMAM